MIMLLPSRVNMLRVGDMVKIANFGQRAYEVIKAEVVCIDGIWKSRYAINISTIEGKVMPFYRYEESLTVVREMRMEKVA